MPWKHRRFYLDPPSFNPEEEFLSWKRTIYRFYAWFIVSWMLVYFYGRFQGETRFLLSEIHYLDVFLSIPALIGVLTFAYRKRILWPWFWRIYTPFIIGWDLWGSFWFMQTPEECLDFFQGGWVFFMVQYILLLPMYFGLFRLGFQR